MTLGRLVELQLSEEVEKVMVRSVLLELNIADIGTLQSNVGVFLGREETWRQELIRVTVHLL